MIVKILPKITALAIIAPPKRTMVFSALKTALSCLELGLSVASKRSSSSLSSKMLLKVEPPPETESKKVNSNQTIIPIDHPIQGQLQIYIYI